MVISQWLDPLLDPDTGLAPRLTSGPDRQPPRIVSGTDAVHLLANVDKTDAGTLLVGSTRLARHAISAQVTTESIETFPTYRFNSDQVLAWLQRRRAAEFTGRDAAQRIMQATAGIPLLVGAFDRILIRDCDTAPTISSEELDDLLAILDAEIPALRAGLLDPDHSDGLLPREVELVMLICRASDEFSEHEMMVMAVEDQEIELPVGVEPYCPQDTPALRLLVQLGLLPRAQQRVGAGLDQGKGSAALEQVGLVTSDDPIRRLLDIAPA